MNFEGRRFDHASVVRANDERNGVQSARVEGRPFDNADRVVTVNLFARLGIAAIETIDVKGRAPSFAARQYRAPRWVNIGSFSTGNPPITTVTAIGRISTPKIARQPAFNLRRKFWRYRALPNNHVVAVAVAAGRPPHASRRRFVQRPGVVVGASAIWTAGDDEILQAGKC